MMQQLSAMSTVVPDEIATLGQKPHFEKGIPHVIEGTAWNVVPT